VNVYLYSDPVFFFKVSTLCSESQPNEKIWQGWPCFFDLLRPTAWRKRARRLLLETWSNSIQKYLNVEQYKQFPYLNEPGYVVICLLFFSDPYFPFFQPRKQWISISGKRTPSSPIIIFLLINCGFLKITPQIDYFRHLIVPLCFSIKIGILNLPWCFILTKLINSYLKYCYTRAQTTYRNMYFIIGDYS